MKLSIINTLLLIAILAYLVIGSVGTVNDKKEAYVVTGELFSEFDYQKELDIEYKKLREDKMKNLESMRAHVLSLEERARSEKATQQEIANYQYRYNEFLQAEASVNEELTKINGEYSVKIWDKINSLVSQFGEENNYEVIFGAGGSGNIMYAHEGKNITNELIAFCNLKYNGK